MKYLILTTLAAAPLLTAAAAAPDVAASYASAAGTTPSADRGRQLFTTRHGREWSCSSCHGDPPVGQGRHANTGKPIEPLAPVANPARLTDPAKVEKWLRRNCNDVVGRECTAQEKADVVHWLATLRM